MMRIGLYISTRGGISLDGILSRFERAEADGFHTAWVGHTDDHDALTLLALAGRATSRIELGSWVVPAPPRHPAALAQQALTVQSASGGRLVLGLGASHAAVIEKRLGLDASRPVGHMREYLAVLGPLLAGKRVEHAGDRYRVSMALETSGARAPAILLAALGPQMLSLAGSRADGVALWLGGPRFLSGFALPRLREAAEKAGRPSPRIACGLPVAVTEVSRGRAAANAFLSPSARLPAYRRVLERGSARSPADVAIVGDEEMVARGLAELAALGVDDFNAVILPVEGDPEAPRRTRAHLALLARQPSLFSRSSATEFMQ